MTTEAAGGPAGTGAAGGPAGIEPLPARARPGLLAAFWQGRSGPVLVVALALVAIWYLGAVWLNTAWQLDVFQRQNVAWTTADLVRETLNQDRPKLPAPHQVLEEMRKTILEVAPDSRRSLVYHSWVTLSSTLLGFAIGSGLGILLAVGIVYVKALEKSLMPWVIASQTIPILAIAPMIVVVLGSIGLRGLIPKAIISTYLAFFPVAIGMVKGLRSPDPLQLDLLRTYSADGWQTFWKLRWPASMPYLFAGLKVGIAIALVGAIVGELPTGAQAGLGARLLAGSYYGQTVQIWSALLTAAVIAATLVALVGVVERLVLRRMGGRA